MRTLRRCLAAAAFALAVAAGPLAGSADATQCYGNKCTGACKVNAPDVDGDTITWNGRVIECYS